MISFSWFPTLVGIRKKDGYVDLFRFFGGDKCNLISPTYGINALYKIEPDSDVYFGMNKAMLRPPWKSGLQFFQVKKLIPRLWLRESFHIFFYFYMSIAVKIWRKLSIQGIEIKSGI